MISLRSKPISSIFFTAVSNADPVAIPVNGADVVGSVVAAAAAGAGAADVVVVVVDDGAAVVDVVVVEVEAAGVGAAGFGGAVVVFLAAWFEKKCWMLVMNRWETFKR